MPKRRAKPRLGRSNSQPKKAATLSAKELKQALYKEVINSVYPGHADKTVDKPGVLEGWLKSVHPTLAYLGRLGRGVASKTTVFEQMAQLELELWQTPPQQVIVWLRQWSCLRDLVGPEALEGLGATAVQERFALLGTLDEPLESSAES